MFSSFLPAFYQIEIDNEIIEMSLLIKFATILRPLRVKGLSQLVQEQ